MTDHPAAQSVEAPIDTPTSGGRQHDRGAWGLGIATVTATDDKVLDTWFPHPALGVSQQGAALAADAELVGPGTFAVERPAAEAALGADLSNMVGVDELRHVRVVVVATIIEDLADPPIDAHDAYLRLHLLSHRLVQPNGCSMEGIFGVLNNVTWTNVGPCPVDGFEDIRLQLRAAGRNVEVSGVDKFPRMTDYVVPPGVRIADASRVRLGAHLGVGTMVMHEGFVNFNAGTLGVAMVEGRISQGIVVGEGSDIGGGASIMGTLSGGGKQIVSIGERCLIGANGGIGISLGDDCIVEAGLYVTAGSRVTLPDAAVVKAVELSGRSGLLFRRNSVSGAIEVVARSGSWGGLNADLHAND